jgi:hypothetical protein
MRVMVGAGMAKESRCGRRITAGRNAAESAVKRTRMGRNSPVKLLEILALME